MKNLLMMIVMFLTITTTANAQEKKNKNAKHDVEINGNCEDCKKRIEKAAYSVSGVKSATWDIDSHNLHLILNEEKASVTDVKKKIAAIGHDSDDVFASDVVYDNLHHCCQYDRKPQE